jgi:hypothetical protein
MLGFLAGPAVEGAKYIEPALSTLEKSVIGAILIVSWAITILSVWTLIRVQNKRVDDQKELSNKLDKTTGKMTSAFEKMQSALQALTNAEQASQLAMTAMKTALDVLANDIKMLIFQGGRKTTPPPDPHR